MVGSRARGPLWRGLVGLVAACGGGVIHGHWVDPGVRLVDGMWIGPRAGWSPIREGVRGHLEHGTSRAIRGSGAHRIEILWVALPSQCEPRQYARGHAYVARAFEYVLLWRRQGAPADGGDGAPDALHGMAIVGG
jgi:hypothetical protein